MYSFFYRAKVVTFPNLTKYSLSFLATLDEKTRNKLTHVRFELCQASKPS